MTVSKFPGVDSDVIFREALNVGPQGQDFVLFLREPNIELDMDGWVNWFNELKILGEILTS